MAVPDTSDDLAHLTALVRAHDRPRYYATLFAPAAARRDLLALYGFAAEIARVPDLVSEPALGEIRMKWWQEALADAGRGEGSAPAVRALRAAMARHVLPIEPLDALAEASVADLYSDPPATIADLEGRLGETQSALFQMAAIVLGAKGPETADAAGHAGLAYGIARRLLRFASDRARGRIILPADFLAAAGTSAKGVFAAPAEPGVHHAVSALAKHARTHLEAARKAVAALPPSLLPAFLPFAPVGAMLDRVERHGPAIVERDAGLSDLATLTRIACMRFMAKRQS